MCCKAQREIDGGWHVRIGIREVAAFARLVTVCGPHEPRVQRVITRSFVIDASGLRAVEQVKHSKKLISADNHSNIFNYHYTYLVTLVPVCKDDLVLLPRRLAEQLGNISRLALAQRISSAVQFVDPLSAQTADVTPEKVRNIRCS